MSTPEISIHYQLGGHRLRPWCWIEIETYPVDKLHRVFFCSVLHKNKRVEIPPQFKLGDFTPLEILHDRDLIRQIVQRFGVEITGPVTHYPLEHYR